MDLTRLPLTQGAKEGEVAPLNSSSHNSLLVQSQVFCTHRRKRKHANTRTESPNSHDFHRCVLFLIFPD